MKVVQINATFGNGSTGGIVKDIQQQCLQSGIDCYVAYSLSSISEDKIVNGYQIGDSLDHKIHAVLSRISGKQGYYSKRPTRDLLSWLEEIKPDVINIHNLHSNFINLPMLLKWVAAHNVALVVTLHDCWFFTGGCFHFTSSQCARWKESCGCCPRKNLDIPSLKDSSATIISDRKNLFGQISKLKVVGVSQWTAEMAKQGVFKNTPCTYIYNGVDVDVFKPIKDANAISAIREKYGIKSRFVILGPASKWFLPENNNLLEGTLQLGKEFALVLYGCNAQQIEAPQPQGDNSTQLVKIGFTRSQQELAEIYNMADVFVNCTHEDTFSLINAESQACGTPVVCYANTGAKETVNTQYGRLVETDDVKNMIESIVSLKTVGTQDNYQEELAEWATSHFNKDINYKRYIQLFRELA